MPRLKMRLAEEPAAACCAPIAANRLSDEEAAATAKLFRALADPARVKLINLLLASDTPVCVCDLTPFTGLAQPTVSYHLKKLLEAGLVRRQERGTWAYYSVDGGAIARLGRVADARRRTRRPA